MSRGLAILAAAAFLIGGIAFFPLRVALAGLESQGLSARQVTGTIWYGRVGELMLKRIRLGTFEGHVEPLSMFSMRPALVFSRMEDPDGPLTGKLRLGSMHGIEHGTGRLSAQGLFGDVPITDLQIEDATLLFNGALCKSASGRVTAVIAAPMPGLGGGFTGTPSCDGKRVRAKLSGPAGATLEIYIASDGRYRAWLRAKADSADVAATLGAAGFRPSAGDMVLSAAGML